MAVLVGVVIMIIIMIKLMMIMKTLNKRRLN